MNILILIAFLKAVYLWLIVSELNHCDGENEMWIYRIGFWLYIPMKDISEIPLLKLSYQASQGPQLPGHDYTLATKGYFPFIFRFLDTINIFVRM